MERPKIQMMVNDGEEEELVELAAPSADAAIRLKLGDTFKKWLLKLHHRDAFETCNTAQLLIQGVVQRVAENSNSILDGPS